MRIDFWTTAAAVLAFSLVLLALRPKDRPTVRNNLLWLLLLAATEGAGALTAQLGGPQAASMIAALTTIGLGGVIIRLGALTLFRLVLPALRVGVPRIFEDLAVIGAFVAWVWMWLHLSGFAFSSIVATSAVFTGIIVFSMQETLGNILGGMAVQLDNSIHVGDWVKYDDVSGRVVEVRWRYTAIETRNRETVIVPNSLLMKNRITVIGSRSDAELRWRRWVWFSISLDANPRRVCEVLERALHNADVANVARDPVPSAVLMDIADGAGRYALRYWLTNPQADDPTDSLVRAHCYAALQRHGMSIALPQQEHLLVNRDSSYSAARESEDMNRRLAALRRVDVFRALTDEELATLARHLVRAPFVAGATMTRQGDVAHWLYLIIAGEADVGLDLPNAPRKLIATLRAGDIFGEMGMMTGDPRSATVTARTDVDCYRLDKEGFANIVVRRPDIATEMSQVLAKRREELERFRENGTAGGAAMQETILARIRGFFGLN